MKPLSTLLALSLMAAPVVLPVQADAHTLVSGCTQTETPDAAQPLHAETPNAAQPPHTDASSTLHVNAPYNASQPSTRTGYWKAYRLYLDAVALIDRGDKESAKDKLSEGIDVLDDLDSKDAEDYALLTLLYTASCRCYSFPRIIASMRGSVKNAEKAQKLGADYLRVLYALALKDYYTPDRHGGFKQVETILNKALALPVPSNLKDGEPAWGRKECYELLVQYLLKKNETQKAKAVMEKGLQEFPNSALLKESI